MKHYGSPRLAQDLNRAHNEKRVSAATVARRMHVLGLVARAKRKYVHTTDSAHKQSMSRKGNCWDNAVAESF